MSQRASGYARRAMDLYETPAWVLDPLRSYIADKVVWEPACGTGQMVKAMMELGAARCYATDVVNPQVDGLWFNGEIDFTQAKKPLGYIDHIITNPPYGPRGKTAEDFIRRGLELLGDDGFLCLLLPIDFDSAYGRRDLFGNCPRFDGKIVLTRRIRWFDGPSSPSANHAWFTWHKTRWPEAARLSYWHGREAA